MKHKIVKIFTNVEDGNIAYHVNDNIDSVNTNRKNIALKYGFDIAKLRYMSQVHKNEVTIVDNTSSLLIDNCDALITNEKNLPLMVMVADCIPILMFDETLGVISVIHAGRNSTFLKIVEETANQMINKFKCKVYNISVIFGPCIQKCCYEVNQNLAGIAKKTFGNQFVKNRHLDLIGINIKLLNNLGILNITTSKICTKCTNDNYFSYRKDEECGRFAGVIVLL